MSCNSALDHRGDTPALAVIDRNARSLAQRAADETKEELAKVLKRVDYIYAHFELTESLEANAKAENLEYLKDVAELEELIKDQVKKKKYQHQVTIFIVGYENVCGQKLRLLQQINEFFMDNANKFDEEETMLKSPELDLEDSSETMEESLTLAGELTKRLTDIHRETIEYMYNYAQAKASNKSKKKLEKALEKSKEEVATLNEQLLLLHDEIEEKEEKMQQMFKQIEMKNMECQRYKTSAEMAKKNASEADSLRDECTTKTQTISSLQQQLDVLKAQVGEAGSIKERSLVQIQLIKDESAEKLQELQANMEQKALESQAAQTELQQAHEDEMLELNMAHKNEIQSLTEQHQAEIQKILGKPGYTSVSGKESTFASLSKENTRESLPRGSHKIVKKIHPASRNSQVSTTEVAGSDVGRLETENSVGLLSTRSRTRTYSNLQPVRENDAKLEFDESYELHNEAAWDGVPAKHLYGRFRQYRKLAQEKLSDLEKQLQATLAKTVTKVNTLKAQFYEHRQKWQAEREVLLQQVEHAYGLQNDAEKEADHAMEQLENFINKQEELELSEAKLPEIDMNRALELQTDDAKASRAQEDSNLAENDMIAQSFMRDTSAADSRASLRQQQRQDLQMLRKSATERRHKSNTMDSLRSQMSVLSDAELDEDGDMPFPPDDPNFPVGFSREVSLREVATSPMTLERDRTSSTLQSRISLSIVEHPIVQLYMKTYESVVDFKETLKQLFSNKDMMSVSQQFSDMEPIALDKNEKVQPQLEAMTEQTCQILVECAKQVSNLLEHPSQREYPVSPITNTIAMVSPEMTMVPPENTLATIGSDGLDTSQQETEQQPDSTVQKQRPNSTALIIQQMQAQYDELKNEILEEKEKNEIQLNHNTVVMMEMQDTINNLQRELATVVQQAATLAQKESVEQSPIMFTRLDSDRNAKMMKRAMNERRLSLTQYQEVMEKMTEYVSLPLQRFASLVRKYTHHCQMKLVEHNIRMRQSHLDEDVYSTLNKMELLQNERAKKWAENMDQMGAKRQQLAYDLLEKLVDIETESGIFLIKPMYSYKAGYPPRWLRDSLTKSEKRPRETTSRLAISTGPLSTPMSNMNQHKVDLTSKLSVEADPTNVHTKQPADTRPENGIVGQAQRLIGDYPQPYWKPSLSESKPAQSGDLNNYYNTPRLLDLDVNRMLIGQNHVSTKLTQPLTSSDRMSQAMNAHARSYLTVNRRAGQSGGSTCQAEQGMITPNGGSGRTAFGNRSGKRVRLEQGDTPSSHSSTPSLPAIGSLHKTHEDYPLPPTSPPGSSLRLSVTPRILESH